MTKSPSSKNKTLTVQLSEDAYDLLMHEKALSGVTFSEIIDGLVKDGKISDMNANEDAYLISKMEIALANSNKYKNVKKRRDALHRKALIMKIALKLFAEKGYHAVTVEDILQHVNITRRTFYQHFKGKENVIELILDTHKHYLEDILIESVASCRGKSSNLWKEILRNKTREIMTMPQIVMFLKVVFGELSQLQASFRDDIISFENKLIDMLAQAIQYGQEMGDFTREFDPRIAAICVTGVVKQIFAASMLNGNAKEALHALGSAYDFFMKGLTGK